MKLQKILFAALLFVEAQNFAMDNVKAGCPNIIGCEFVRACQGKFTKQFPDLGSRLTTKPSELPKYIPHAVRSSIQEELTGLANVVPYLGQSFATGRPVEIKKNSKGETIAVFSQNPWHGLALAAIRPYNDSQGFERAIDQKGMLGIVDNFNFLKSRVVGTHVTVGPTGKKDTKLILVCGLCAQQPK